MSYPHLHSRASVGGELQSASEIHNNLIRELKIPLLRYRFNSEIKFIVSTNTDPMSAIFLWFPTAADCEVVRTDF